VNTNVQFLNKTIQKKTSKKINAVYKIWTLNW